MSSPNLLSQSISDLSRSYSSDDHEVIFGILDWGLGHASRSIAVIKALQSKRYKITVFSDSLAAELVRKELPDIPLITSTPYGVKYYFDSIVLNLLFQFPKICRAIIGDYLAVDKFIHADKKVIVISDCRFGFFSNKAAINIFITHQLDIHYPSKWVSFIFRSINEFFIKKFNLLWIPDLPTNPSLAGKLSHPDRFPIPYSYIGPLSRYEIHPAPSEDFTLIILSGPEPKRTLLENKLLDVVAQLPNYKFAIIRGTRSECKRINLPNTQIADFVTFSELNGLLNSAKRVISRAGYSSLMDYHVLGKKALIIPTKGQSEQEYLGVLHKNNRNWYVLNEEEISLVRVEEFLNS